MNQNCISTVGQEHNGEIQKNIYQLSLSKIRIIFFQEFCSLKLFIKTLNNNVYIKNVKKEVILCPKQMRILL